MVDDSELLLRYASQGDQAAFRELVDRHLGKVYAVALRKAGGNAHLAQDAAQAVFTDLARKAHALSRHRVLSGWLFLSARYAASSLIRNERRRQLLAMKAGPEITSHAQREPDWSAARPEIDDAIHELGTPDREALLLRFFEGRTFADIGRRLSVSEDGARLRVERALGKLRGKLERRGIPSSAAALAGTLALQAGAASVPAQASAIASTALLSVAPAAGGAATFAVMTTSTKLGLAGVALGLLAVGFKADTAYHRVIAERDQARTELAIVQHKNAALLAKLASPGAGAAGPGRAGPGALQKANDLPAFAIVHTAQVLKDHPEAIPAHERGLRRSTMLKYGQAIAAMHFDPATAARLKDLLMERDLAENQAGMAAYNQGIDPDSKEAQSALLATRDNYTTPIKALIGEDALTQLDKLSFAFQDQATWGRISAGYAADMEVAGAPLTASQNQALQVAVQAAYVYRNTDTNTTTALLAEDPASHLTPQDNDLLAAVSTTLSASQLETLKVSLIDKNDYNRLFMSRASPKGGTVTLVY